MSRGDKQLFRVLVADHHRAMRSGIRVMLGEARGSVRFELVEVETADEVLIKVRTGGFDVVLLAMDLPGLGGIKTTELVLKRAPGLRILGLMEKPERVAVEKLLIAGAMGCILTNIEPDTLVSAIRSVLEGRRFFSNEIALCLLEPGKPPDPGERLTRRETEVLRGILAGWHNHEIAAKFGISKRTVDKHRQRVNAKLGVRNMIELVQVCLRMGLVSGMPFVSK